MNQQLVEPCVVTLIWHFGFSELAYLFDVFRTDTCPIRGTVVQFAYRGISGKTVVPILQVILIPYYLFGGMVFLVSG